MFVTRALPVLIVLFGSVAWSVQPDKLQITVKQSSYTVCAADSDVARVTVHLLIEEMNNSPRKVIVSRRVEIPLPLTVVDSKPSNFDAFRTEPMEQIAVTSDPPQELFAVLRPRQAATIAVDGWFLASRNKNVPGTLKPGRYRFTGMLDVWPFDESNIADLSTRWENTGKLITRKRGLPPFDFDFAIAPKISPCKT